MFFYKASIVILTAGDKGTYCRGHRTPEYKVTSSGKLLHDGHIYYFVKHMVTYTRQQMCPVKKDP